MVRRKKPGDPKEARLSDYKAGDLITLSEFAQMCKVDPTTVRRWIEVGTVEAVVLPAGRHRHSYRVTYETVVAMLTPKLLGGH